MKKFNIVTKEFDKEPLLPIWFWIVMLLAAILLTLNCVYQGVERKKRNIESKQRYIFICDSISTIDDSLFNEGVMSKAREAQDIGIQIGIDSGVNIEIRKYHLKDSIRN